jgi:hypothetical protein
MGKGGREGQIPKAEPVWALVSFEWSQNVPGMVILESVDTV